MSSRHRISLHAMQGVNETVDAVDVDRQCFIGSVDGKLSQVEWVDSSSEYPLPRVAARLWVRYAPLGVCAINCVEEEEHC